VSETNHLLDDGFHEIQLSGKQLVFLFMATTIAAVAIFLCGVQVGRNVRSDRAADLSDAPAAVPAATTPAPSPPVAAASGPPAAEPPAPAEGDEDLSYAKRLQSDKSPKEKLKPEGDATHAPAAVAAAPPIKTATPSTPPAQVAADARPADAKPLVSTAPGVAPRPGVWVVQLVALKDRGAAAGIVQRLSTKGYPAFLVNPAPGAPTIYRVQVGRYNDRAEADQVKRRLEQEEQYKPWIDHSR
jgi:cell division septation protein DedD